MAVRIQLHTLGDALITVGEKEVRPSSPIVFAGLLYLSVERGHRVPRAALRELLFPETDERSGAHSVRQLLYKLRQLGVPLRSDEATVELPAEAVCEGLPSVAEIASDSMALARVSAGVLPNYSPSISPEFNEWVDDYRTGVGARSRGILLDALTRSRDAGDHAAMDVIANAVLKLDPLNEEATLVRAEVLALTGQKQNAIRVLEQYSAEVGVTSPHLQIPPDLLRRRIAERFHASDRAAVPMLGRQEELAFLLAQYGRAVEGKGTVSIVWGEAGIGKTRLVEEFRAHLALKNARVESAHCQSFDKERPLGALMDLVPKLLQARGALGVSPESMQQLKRLSGEFPAERPDETHPELTAARIREAIADLLACVSAERPLVLIVEDAHWLDEASWRLLLALIPGQPARLHLGITMRDRPRLPNGTRLSESVVTRQLAPLNDVVAGDLLQRSLGAGFALDVGVREQCVALAAGNPMFICTVAEHLRLRGAAPSSKSGIADLLKQKIRILDPPSLLLLRTIAALGNHATPQRLRACTGVSLEVELLALQDLADRGLITRENGSTLCAHDLLTEAVLFDAPPAIRTALYERAATVLEADGVAGKQVQLLWSCAESWLRADDRDRAYRALRKCADFAVEIGQPQFACAALLRAQELTEGMELLAAVRETIVVGEKCMDPDIVLRNVRRHRELSSRHSVSDTERFEVDLAEIDATRWRLASAWDYAAKLRRIAHSHTTAPEVRLRAARSFLVSAEQELKKAEAVDFFNALAEHRLYEQSPYAWSRFKLLYHASFGDVDRIAECVDELEDFIPRESQWQQLMLLGYLGIAWLRAGQAFKAISCLEQCTQKAERFGLLGTLMNYGSQLSYAFLIAGEQQAAIENHQHIESLLTRAGTQPAAAFVAISIDHALLEGNHRAARQYLGALAKSVHGRDTPYNHRFAIAYDLIISRLEGRLYDVRMVRKVEQLHLLGRSASEHDCLAAAYAILLAGIGQSETAVAEFTEYCQRWRRDRHSISPLLLKQLEDALNAGALT